MCLVLFVECVYLFLVFFFFLVYGDHQDLHVLTHSFPTRRSSDLSTHRSASCRSRGRHRARAYESPRRHAPLPIEAHWPHAIPGQRSEEHTSELQSLMRISYAVFCLKTKKKHHDIVQSDSCGVVIKLARVKA